MSHPAPKVYTEKDWDSVRQAFQTSLMVDTPLSSLAQNLDMNEWPIAGDDQTPSKYIDYSWADLMEHPSFQADPARVQMLITLLKETLAFDEPFGEMVEQTAQAEARDNPILKNLERLEIPANFPISLTQLSAETKDFCRLEKLETLGEFAVFSMSMAQAVIVGGDYREMLNALVNLDEKGLAKFLPFRPGSKGLWLPEALRLEILAIDETLRLALYKNIGGKLAAAQDASVRDVTREQIAEIDTTLCARVELVTGWFGPQVDELALSIKQGTKIERSLVILDDPVIELIGSALLKSAVASAQRRMEEARDAAKRFGATGEVKTGFFARLMRFFRK